MPISRCGTVSGVLTIVLIVYSLSWKGDPADQPSVANSTGSRATSTLVFVIIVTRHGNRSPLYTVPALYPNTDTRFWPYGKGQLTNRGREQMYNLGKKIRSLYNGFLNETYNQGHFKAYSTVVDRTLESAELFLAGLFPPKGFQVWNKELTWQPIPIYPTYLDHNDYNLAQKSKVLCPRFYEDQYQSAKKFERKNKKNITSLLEYLEPYIGLIGYPLTLEWAWDCMFCVDNEGLPLPNWTKSVYPEPLRSLRAEEFEANLIATDKMIRLLQGPLFQEMMGLMQARANGKLSPDQRMYYYSAHDSTLIGMRGILGLGGTDLGIVNAASAYILEMHRAPQKNGHYIQVLYVDGNSTDFEPTAVKIPECRDPCQFGLLMNITEKYYNIRNLEKECDIN